MIIAADIIPIQVPMSWDIAGWLGILLFLMSIAKLILWFTDRNKPEPPLHKTYVTKSECDLKMTGVKSREALDDLYPTRREWEQSEEDRKADRKEIKRDLKTLLQRTAHLATDQTDRVDKD